MTDSRWSANKVKAWHRCHRLFRNRYVLGLGEPSTPVQDFGNVGHAALQDRLTEYMGENGQPWPRLSDPFEQARLDAVLTGYQARWNDDREVYSVLAVEQSFEYELAGHIIQGRMDGIVQRIEDGRVLVKEHKFTGSDVSGGSAYWEKLVLDTQVSIYTDAATALGYDVAGVIYDVIAKPRHEPKKATPEADRTYTKGKGCKVCGGKAAGVRGSGRRITPKGPCTAATAANDLCAGCPACECPACNGAGWEEPPRLHANQRAEDETPDEFHDRILADIAKRPDDFYTRQTVVRTSEELPRMRADLLDTIKLARAAEVFDVFPRNGDACHQYGTRCWFWDLCCATSTIDDPRWFKKGDR